MERLFLEHDPEKWTPVFRKRSCSNKRITLEFDSTQLNQTLGCGFADADSMLAAGGGYTGTTLQLKGFCP
jgi:hypothetical protein